MIGVNERIEKYTNEDGKFVWDMGTVMNYIRPNCLFEISMYNGEVNLTKWEEYNNWDNEKHEYIPRPSNFEIVREMLIQETIAECIKHPKN
jgi:hypothetical protein